MDPEFIETVRRLLDELNSRATEPKLPEGGALAHVLRGPGGVRTTLRRLADRWFTPPSETLLASETPILNLSQAGEAERLHTLLVGHILGRQPWAEFSTNESTFYRYRRVLLNTLAELLWDHILRRPIPDNSPRPDFQRLLGREAELAQVLRGLADLPHPVIVLEGLPGYGKSALAQQVISECWRAARSWRPLPTPDVAPGAGKISSLTGSLSSPAVPVFDAFVWLSAVDPTSGGGLSLADVLEGLGRVLDAPAIARQRSALALLHEHPTLLVVDNAESVHDPAVISLLRHLPAPSRALWLTRRRVDWTALTIPVGPLPPEAAIELLRAAGPQPLHQAATTALQPVVAAAHGAPLALVWAAGQLRHGQTLERVAVRLQRAEGEVFSDMLADTMGLLSPAGRAVMTALGVLATPATRQAILAAAGQATGGNEAGKPVRDGLDELLELQLAVPGSALTESEQRYDLHPLTRAFVSLQWATPDALELARFRAVTYYVALARKLGGGARSAADLAPLTAELANILALAEVCATHATGYEPRGEAIPVGANRRAGSLPVTSDELPAPRQWGELLLRLAEGLRNLFWIQGRWRDGLRLFGLAADIAGGLGDVDSKGWNQYRMALILYNLGEFLGTQSLASQAFEHFQQAADLRGTGHALRLIGLAESAQDLHEDAMGHLRWAVELLAQHGRGGDRAIALATLADGLLHAGQAGEAHVLYHQVLDPASGLTDPGTKATTLNHLGQLHLMQADLATARAHFAEALVAASEVAQPAQQLAAHRGLAEVEKQLGHIQAARVHAQAAEDLERSLGTSPVAFCSFR